MRCSLRAGQSSVGSSAFNSTASGCAGLTTLHQKIRPEMRQAHHGAPIPFCQGNDVSRQVPGNILRPGGHHAIAGLRMMFVSLGAARVAAPLQFKIERPAWSGDGGRRPGAGDLKTVFTSVRTELKPWSPCQTPCLSTLGGRLSQQRCSPG
jgi:hypothetical protein